MSRLALLDSARHKLRLGRYHGDTLLHVLAQNPLDVPDEPLRVSLEAHLEGLAYTGTAALEKTIRSLDPDGIPDRASIAQMIRAALASEAQAERALARDLENWWMGRRRQTRFAEIARDLRNDAAHDVYDKAMQGRRWQMRIGNREPVAVEDFARGFLNELDELEALVADAERLAGLAPAR